jgi:hypothetical protein
VTAGSNELLKQVAIYRPCSEVEKDVLRLWAGALFLELKERGIFPDPQGIHELLISELLCLGVPWFRDEARRRNEENFPGSGIACFEQSSGRAAREYCLPKAAHYIT